MAILQASRQEVGAMFKNAFDIKSDTASYEEVHQRIVSGATIRGTNTWILMLAALIASIGLNLNSTAVIIGAMLVSPLMGGIMAAGYGLARCDLAMVKNAILGVILQMTVSITVSAIYFSLSPLQSVTSELLSRTSPTFYDVGIAIFGGLAGMIGMTRLEKGNVIPGVAIATALMPPLCTAGYGLGTHQWAYFLGALYLFFINSFFIALSTLVICKYINVPAKVLPKDSQRKIVVYTAAIAIFTTVPAVILGYGMIQTGIVTSNANDFVNTEFSFTDTQVVSSAIDVKNDTIKVALIGKNISDSEISDINAKQANYGIDMALTVSQTEVSDGVTKDEMFNLIDTETTNASQLAVKDAAISQLDDELTTVNAELETYKMSDVDIEELTAETQAMFPNVASLTAGNVKSWDEAAQESTDSFSVLVYVTQALNTGDAQRLADWVRVKQNVVNSRVYIIMDSKVIESAGSTGPTVSKAEDDEDVIASDISSVATANVSDSTDSQHSTAQSNS